MSGEASRGVTTAGGSTVRISKTTKRFLFVAGALLAILSLAACGDDDTAFGDFDGGEASRTDGRSDDGVSESLAAPIAAAADFGAPDAPPNGGVDGSSLVTSASRKIIFTSSLALDVEDVSFAFHAVSQIAGNSGGFVESSDLSRQVGDDGELFEFASITIRIPATRYGDVLAELRTLTGGTVTHEDSRSTEVTEEYSDLTTRIHNLERTESRYLLLLDDAETIQDILLMTDRLDTVRLQIEQLQGRINLLDDLVELTTIHVSIDPVSAPVAFVTTDGSGPFGAFADAWGVSLLAAERLLVLLAYASVALMWLAPLGLVAFIVARVHGRGAARAV